MKHHCTRLSYESTGYFSSIVADYLAESATLRPFYAHLPGIEGIQDAIRAREQFATPRNILVTALKEQYRSINTDKAVAGNMEALADAKTFTVVTAHQPNIFTGPLYFVYKILHIIQLAKYLSEQMPAYRFVPVYYMGSEDADLDELGQISIDGNKLSWNTIQTGAVGRMLVDKELIKLLSAIEGQTGVLPFGKELSVLFREAYTNGRTIQEATLHLVNALFGRFGLVVLIPDQHNLKSAFSAVIQKELLEGFSHKIVNDTISELGKNYKVQAGGRAINLFYLVNNRRERIEKDGDDFVVNALDIRFTKEQILNELKTYPERFSPNVILRGAFQETILPNIAFIGGGGELAYWLELKEVFKAINVPYPVLVLRNSFLLMTSEQEKRMQQLELTHQLLFSKANLLLEQLVKKRTGKQLNLSNETAQLTVLYEQIKQQAASIDETLMAHVEALLVKASKRLTELEKKMLRAEKRKFETEERQIQSLKQQLFPGDSLQERVENVSGWYARYGSDWIDILLQNSLSLEAEFMILTLEGNI
ncbi:MAG: bacillithiol biosynthesis cysteine-adding enzyme BshC [Bacteroidota bacterium]